MKWSLFFRAVTVALRAYELKTVNDVEDDNYEIDQKVLEVGNRGTPDDKLRLEIEATRKQNKRELLSAIRSAYSDAEKRR